MADVELTKEDLEKILTAARAMAKAASKGEDYPRLLASVLQVTACATASDRASVYRLDASARALVLSGCHPRDARLEGAFGVVSLVGSFTGRTLASLRAAASRTDAFPPAVAAVVRDVGLLHMAVVPLHISGEPSGSLNLGRLADRPYTPRDLAVAEALGELLVVYLENARMISEARSRLDETRMLLEVGRAVTATLDLDARLVAAAEILARLVDASNTFILLLDDERSALVGIASSNASHRELFRTVRIPMTASSLAVRAVTTRAPAVVEDAERSNLVRRDLVERFGEKSLVALPLLVRGEPIGAVVMDDTRRARAWSAAEIQRAELIALQIAGAVANARLYEEVKAGYARLARAQAELVSRERLAAIGQLAATLAHEVRNPLGVLFNSLGTLAKTLPAEGDAATLLAIMGEETRRLDRLVRELLDFARPVRLELEVASIVDVVQSALRGAAQELDEGAATMTAELPEGLPKVSLDSARVRRALVNLLVNGSQAAGSNGRVVVRARTESRHTRELVRVEVEDDGVGMTEAVAARIFEPFFTTKATGTGLGLAIVKGIVDAHNGELEVVSAPGAGTRVAVLLPLARDGAGLEPARSPTG